MRNASFVLLLVVLLPALAACGVSRPDQATAASPAAATSAPSPEPSEPPSQAGLPTPAPGEVRIALLSPNDFPVQNAPIIVNIGEARFTLYGSEGGTLLVTLTPQEYAALAEGASVTVGGGAEGRRRFGKLHKGALRDNEIRLEEDFFLEQQELVADLVEAQTRLSAAAGGDWLGLAAAHLEKTLAPSLWREGSRLDLRAGQGFFEETERAAGILAQGIEEAGDKNTAWLLGGYARRLGDIASGVIWHAATDPMEAALGEDVLREIASERRAAHLAGTFDDYRGAFAHYRKAWDLATTRE